MHDYLTRSNRRITNSIYLLFPVSCQCHTTTSVISVISVIPHSWVFLRLVADVLLTLWISKLLFTDAAELSIRNGFNWTVSIAFRLCLKSNKLFLCFVLTSLFLDLPRLRSSDSDPAGDSDGVCNSSIRYCQMATATCTVVCLYVTKKSGPFWPCIDCPVSSYNNIVLISSRYLFCLGHIWNCPSCRNTHSTKLMVPLTLHAQWSASLHQSESSNH